MDREINVMTSTTNPLNEEPEENIEQTKYLWGHHRTLEQQHNVKRSNNTTSKRELSAYFQRNV